MDAATDPELRLDLAQVLARHVAATSSGGTSQERLDALMASCADVPALLLELHDARRAFARSNVAPNLLDSWMRHLADHMDYELYRLRLAAEPVLAHLRETGVPARLVVPLADALAPPLPWAAPSWTSASEVRASRGARSRRSQAPHEGTS